MSPMPLFLVIIQSWANWLVRASATLRLSGTVDQKVLKQAAEVGHDVKSVNPLYPYCTCHTKKRRCIYTTVLIDLLWFNVVHYSSSFQYFFSIYYGPYSSWKYFLWACLLNFFGLWPCIPHPRHCVPQYSCISIIAWKVKWSSHYASLPAVFNPLYSNTNNNCRTSAIKVATTKITDDFVMNGSHHVLTTKLALFTVNKDEGRHW